MSSSSVTSHVNSSNLSAIKNCLLCFHEFNDHDDAPEYSSKLHKICWKYLHSSLTLQTRSNSNDFSLHFCPKCLESAEKLVNLTDQMEFFNKSIYELVFIFSLEVLHRRGKVTDGVIGKNNVNYGKKLVEFDVFALPNCDSWNAPTISSAEKSQCDSENIYSRSDENLTSGLTDNDYLTSGIIPEDMEIKCEYEEDEWTGENFIPDSIELPTGEEKDGESVSFAAVEKNQMPVPVLKLKRLQFGIDNTGAEVIQTEIDRKTDSDVNNQREENILTTVLTANDLGSSFTEVYIKPEYQVFTGASDTEGQYSVSTEESMRIIAAPLFSTGQLENSLLAINEESESLENSTNQIGEEDCSLKPSIAKKFQCDVCERMFEKKANLANHARSHADERPYSCDLCDDRFKYKQSLFIHKRKHIVKTRHKCHICGKEFSTEGFLEAHTRKVHNRTLSSNCGKQFQCTTCFKRLSSKHLLKIHMARHT